MVMAYVPKANTYVGSNLGDYAVLKNGVPFDPEPSLKVRNHSPTGFAWGYWGSGPAQLALAILMEECGQEIAERYYQVFKEKVVGALPNGEGATWRLTSADVYAWMSEHLAGRVDYYKQQMEGHQDGSSEWRDSQHGYQEALADVTKILGTRFARLSETSPYLQVR